jgi:hypothetical protein
MFPELLQIREETGSTMSQQFLFLYQLDDTQPEDNDFVAEKNWFNSETNYLRTCSTAKIIRPKNYTSNKKNIIN